MKHSYHWLPATSLCTATKELQDLAIAECPHVIDNIIVCTSAHNSMTFRKNFTLSKHTVGRKTVAFGNGVHAPDRLLTAYEQILPLLHICKSIILRLERFGETCCDECTESLETNGQLDWK